MKTAVLHLSDLHISSEEDFVVSNSGLIAKGIRYYTNECSQCVIVVTGDIIDKGNVESYGIAKNFFNTLKVELTREKDIIVNFILVPGNHDIDFSSPQKLRNMAIGSLSKLDFLGSDNEELIQSVLAPQKSFWDFYSDLTGEEKNSCVSCKKSIDLNNGGKLIFHCYNTAHLSTINEQPGSLIIYEDSFLLHLDRTPKDIIACIFHHSPSWLSTRTPRNNQKLFQKHLLKEANIIMCGHEHMSHTVTVSSNYKASGILYMEADSFKYGNDKIFDLVIIDDESERPSLEKLSFKISEDKCHLISENALDLQTDKVGLTFSESHFDYLSKLSLPIKHPRIEKLTLQDVYVYPDIAPLSKDNTKSLYIHEDSSNFISRALEDKAYVFDGENQAGKTAFLKELSLDGFNSGIYPLWINGADIKHPNLLPLLKKLSGHNTIIAIVLMITRLCPKINV